MYVFSCACFTIGLERCGGEVVTEILRIIETSLPEDAEVRLVMSGKTTSMTYLVTTVLDVIRSRVPEFSIA